MNPRAFAADPATAWLNSGDAAAIDELVKANDARRSKGRVRSALWYLEAAARSYFDRWFAGPRGYPRGPQSAGASRY